MPKPAEAAVPNLALYDLRDARGWSQQDEADRLNELARHHGLPDAITANVVSRWERGIVEVIGLCGYYTMVSMTLNTFEFGLPDGEVSDLA